MPRLSIELSSKEHQQLKAIAALKGQSIKDYVLSRTLAPTAGQPRHEEAAAHDLQALNELRALLEPRVTEAENGELFDLSADDVGAEGRARLKSQN